MEFERLKTEAEAGSFVSKSILGICHLYGQGDVPKDYAAARFWLSQAAERGASRPIFHLGRMHEEGWGVPVDYKKAGGFYQRAADRGEWMAYVYLARLYRHGRGTPVNLEAALEWYDAAVSESETIVPCDELEEALEFVNTHKPAN
ncbi:MAG TPA: tetratricopeptide repeat protein [Verrucomicrobiae bacterium]|jgi:TPR repeat protein|nr:tetratricopeptide repeat protein [Verrucomicrobiae bacterium]